MHPEMTSPATLLLPRPPSECSESPRGRPPPPPAQGLSLICCRASCLGGAKAVGETTPSRPCRRGPQVLCVAPQLLAAAQHRIRWHLVCITSRLPRRLSRGVSQRGKCMSIFGLFPPSVQLYGGPS